MLILGIILLAVGFLAGIELLWVVGLCLALLGGVLMIAGSTGHPIGGRRHYW